MIRNMLTAALRTESVLPGSLFSGSSAPWEHVPPCFPQAAGGWCPCQYFSYSSGGMGFAK